MAHLKAVLPILRTINAASFPGITHTSRETVKQLLEDNKKYHIFFNDLKFHNHVVHHLLDVYALGGSPERLHEIYKEHIPLQRPAPPKIANITESNWREYIEKSKHWTDYVDFFANEVQLLGVPGTLNKYFFLPEIFGRMFGVGGINHGIIHLGFGVELQEPLIVAEGFAMAALEPNMEFLLHLPTSSSSPTSLRDIFEQVHNDKRFEQSRGSQTSILQEYFSKWDVKGTENDLADKEKELFEMIVLIYAAPIPPGKCPLFDFSIMHALTASVSVHELLKFFPSDKGAKILKAHFAVTLMFYVNSARPKLHIDNLKSYSTKLPTSPNPWLEIIKFGIETNDVHATKVTYALLQGEAWFGEFDGIFLKAAQITADASRVLPNSGIYQENLWSHGGLGWDGVWEDQNSQPAKL